MSEAESLPYHDAWQHYWSGLPDDDHAAFWDSAPEYGCGMDLPRLRQALDQELPLIDFGCGNGTQTKFLAEHFPRVVGVDVSEAAVAMARSRNPHPRVEYQALDGTSAAQVEGLATRLGDANLYMRAVLHQMQPDHRTLLVQALKRLMGRTGALYMVELSEQAEGYFRELAALPGGPPPGLTRVFESGITPGLLSVREVYELFSGYAIEHGPSAINTVHMLADGTRAQVPAFYALIRERSAAPQGTE